MSEPRLHHIGFVVNSIEESMPGMLTMLGGTWDARVIHDPCQKVRVAFLLPDSSVEPQIELVEPAAEDSPVRRFLELHGAGLHHLCYEVVNLDRHLIDMRAKGALRVKAPSPAVAFAQRRIAWMRTPQHLLVEYLESV